MEKSRRTVQSTGSSSTTEKSHRHDEIDDYFGRRVEKTNGLHTVRDLIAIHWRAITHTIVYLAVRVRLASATADR